MQTLKTLGRRLFAAACLVLGLSTAQARTTTVTFFHNDLSGSPVAASDATGKLLWKESYRPYGSKLVNSAGSSANTVGFAGRPHDTTTGLSYMEARYYDPLIGRFMGVHPALPDPGELHSLNRYAYANNNPYRYVDPDGHSPLDVAFFILDLGKLGSAIYSGNPAAIGEAGADVLISAVGVVSPIPGTGQAFKAARAADKVVDAGRTIGRGAEQASVTAKGVDKVSTLKQGPFAKESIPGHVGKPTAAEQRQVNGLMEKNGCHTCGTKDPGTRSRNAVVDHQPPQALGESTRFYPHCIDCARRQGGEVLQELIKRGQ